MEKKLSILAIIYFLIGIVFAFYYAFYYHWSGLAYFSPGFYAVVFTWPYQALGFIKDITYYGALGKPI
jgi:hypothetical protein